MLPAGLVTLLLVCIPGIVAQTYPICANTCIYGDALSESGCSITDGKCLCTSTSYLKSAVCCIQANCDSTDQTSAFSVAEYNCATWGVTLDTSASVSCPSATSTAASNTGTANADSTATSIATDSSNSDYGSTSSYKKKKGGLSSGAKGGIGGGVTAVALALLGALTWYLKRRQNKKAGAPATAIDTPPSDPSTVSQVHTTTMDGKFPIVGVATVPTPAHSQPQTPYQQTQHFTPGQPQMYPQQQTLFQGTAMAPGQQLVFTGSELQAGQVQRPHELGST